MVHQSVNQIRFNSSDNYNDLSIDEKSKYKNFVTSIIKLKRDTLKLVNNVPNITETELPHFMISYNKSIIFSVKSNCWILINHKNREKFNPKLLTGILNFLKDFELDIIIDATEMLNNDIHDLLIKYNLT